MTAEIPDSIPDQCAVRVFYQNRVYIGCLLRRNAETITLRTLSRWHWTETELPASNHGSVVEFYRNLTGDAGMALLVCLEKDFEIWSNHIRLLDNEGKKHVAMHAPDQWTKSQTVSLIEDPQVALAVAKHSIEEKDFYGYDGEKRRVRFGVLIPKLQDARFLDWCLKDLEGRGLLKKGADEIWKDMAEKLKKQLAALPGGPKLISEGPYR